MARERYYGQRDHELRQVIGEEVRRETLAMHNSLAVEPIEETPTDTRQEGDQD